MHPLLFEIPLGSLGAIRVPAFGALLALGFALGLALAQRLAERAGLARERALGAALSALFAGVLGARLGFVVLHHAELGSLAESVSLRSGGLSGIVGLFFGVGLLAWEARRRGLPVRTLLDAAAPSLAIALVLGRIGCWLEGCDAGAVLGAGAPRWLARLGTFPFGSPAWVDQVQAGALSPNAVAALPVHPSELYESALGLVLLGLVLAARRAQRTAGSTALVSLLGYLGLRVLVDFTRVPSADVWCARALLVAAAVFTARWRWRPA
jgi:phosphatidylglycerol:prolipoprotein diacylglycerol transferase